MAIFSERLATFFRVVGALVMRDVRARHGGGLSGMLWLVIEPIVILFVVLFLHTLYQSGQSRVGIPLIIVFITGYVPHFIFRHGGQVGKGAIRSGRKLLKNHPHVDVMDLVIAKLVTETAFAIVAAALVYVASFYFGYVTLPKYPIWIYVGLFIDVWFIFEVSIIFAALGTFSQIAGRLFSPFSLMMIVPFLAFFMLAWLPEQFRYWLLLFPPANAAEAMRYGYIGEAYPTYFDVPYSIEICIILTLPAILGMSIVRRHLRN